MVKYHFKTTEFAVSDTGIHLLRGGFNYQTIYFSDINAIVIEKGKELRNWVTAFLYGAILLVGGVYLSLMALDMLQYNKPSGMRSAKLFLSFFAPFLGVYSIYTALKTGTLLKIYYNHNKSQIFSLKEIKKEKKLNEFKSFMKGKSKAKFARS